MDMFKNFYSDDALPMGFDKTRLPQDKWTPAEVVQVLPNIITQMSPKNTNPRFS